MSFLVFVMLSLFCSLFGCCLCVVVEVQLDLLELCVEIVEVFGFCWINIECFCSVDMVWLEEYFDFYLFDYEDVCLCN